MTLAAIPIMIAAASFEPAGNVRSMSLEVTATVVRPVEIAPPTIRSERAVVTVRNAIGVEVLAAGATVDRSDPNAVLLTSDGAAPMVITLLY